MPVKRPLLFGPVLCQNHIQYLQKFCCVIDNDISSTNVSNENTFNSYYFINMYAKLEQNIA